MLQGVPLNEARLTSPRFRAAPIPTGAVLATVSIHLPLRLQHDFAGAGELFYSASPGGKRCGKRGGQHIHRGSRNAVHRLHPVRTEGLPSKCHTQRCPLLILGREGKVARFSDLRAAQLAYTCQVL